MIDDTDLNILSILQENARIPNAEIARRVGMAPSGVFDRIKRLEERGLITEYAARLNARELGLGILAFVFVKSDERIGDLKTEKMIARIPEVQEVHHIAGEDCYLVKVRTRDTESLGQLLREKFGAIDTVRSTRTTIVLSTIKESGAIPLEKGMGKDAGDKD